MAKAYTSALPVFTTYTPGSAPLGVEAPVNFNLRSEIGRMRAQAVVPPSQVGAFNRQASVAAGHVRGTGAAEMAVRGMYHRPIQDALGKARTDLNARNRGWAQPQPDPRHTPLDNPIASQTRSQSRAVIDDLVENVITSPKFGTVVGSPPPVRVAGSSMVPPSSLSDLYLPPRYVTGGGRRA